MPRLGSQEATYDDLLLKPPSGGINGLRGYERDCRKEPSYYYIHGT